MKLVAWKYFSIVMAMMLALGAGAGALTPGPVNAAVGVCGTINLALGKTVTPITNIAMGAPANIVDGRIDNPSHWYSSGPHITFTLDLESTYSIGKINVFYSQIEGYDISTSQDGIDWTPRFSDVWTCSVGGPVSNAAAGAFSARYIKVDAYNRPAWGQYAGILEIEAYEWLTTPPTPPVGAVGTVNLALNKPVTDKAPGGTPIPSHPLAYAVDGNTSTDWLSNYDGSNIFGWVTLGQIFIDLGAEYSIGKIVVKPSNAHYYTVSRTTATDTIHDQWVFKSYPALFGTDTVMSDTDTFYPNGSFTARYLFVEPVIMWSPSELQSGLFEIEIYEWVAAPPIAQPTITAVNPATGTWGQTLPVIITGTNFSGATAVNFGTGITSTFAVNNATQITATISIAPGAAPGARDVSVTNPDGGATLTGAFTVLPMLPPTGAGSGSSSSAGAGAPAQPVVLPTLAVQSATLSAKTVTPGTPVTVTADITNKSAVNGNKKVTLYVNGQVETTQGVAVNSGSSSKLTFNVSRSEPGDYSVYVDGVPAGSFKVEMFRESDGILTFSAVLVGLAFLIGMVMLRRRQRAG